MTLDITQVPEKYRFVLSRQIISCTVLITCLTILTGRLLQALAFKGFSCLQLYWANLVCKVIMRVDSCLSVEYSDVFKKCGIALPGSDHHAVPVQSCPINTVRNTARSSTALRWWVSLFFVI